MGNIKSAPLTVTSPLKQAVNKGRDRRVRKEIDELYEFVMKVQGTSKGKSILEDFVVQKMAFASDSQELFLFEISERSCTDSIASSKTTDRSSRKRMTRPLRSKTV